MSDLEAEIRSEVMPQLRTLEGAINALVSRQRPGALGRFFQSPGMMVFTIGVFLSAIGFSLRTYFQLQDVIHNQEVVPIIGANFEHLAAAVDNICVAVERVHEYQLAGHRNGISCTRTEIEPLVPPIQRSTSR